MTSDETATTPEPARPALRIVRGTPDEVELAALVAVLAARRGGEEEPAAAARRGGWGDPARRVRVTHLPGAGAWRASVLPR